MGRLLTGLFVGVVALLALGIALVSAMSALTNGMANFMASTALLTSQCVMGFVVLLAVISAGLTVWNVVLMSQRRTAERQMAQPAAHPGIPYWVRNYPPALPQLTQGQTRLPALYTTGEPINDSDEEVEDVLFANWGW